MESSKSMTGESMTPEDALKYIHSVKWQGSKPGLDRTRELLERLGNPEKSFKFVHVAGTNGKGSTAAMTESVLRAAGYRTGLYTSPYITRFNERMQALGEEITDEELARLTDGIRPHADAMEDSPTEFELVTALAMMFYREKNCDIVVLEVGMGGKLDSTNVIDSPECAVITNIGLDHIEQLGETLELIAAEKAGIIKSGCEVIVYEQQESVLDVFRAAAAKLGAPVTIPDFSEIERISDSIEGQTFKYKESPELTTPLVGEHQMKNASTVLETVYALRRRGWSIPDEAILKGFASVSWPARFELLSREPYFIVDVGHNPQCAETVRANLQRYCDGKYRVLMIGVMADKDYKSLINILDDVADAYVAVKPDYPRALSDAKLAVHLRSYGKPVVACGSVAEGVAAARNLALGRDGIACAVGSCYMAGDVRAQFGL